MTKRLLFVVNCPAYFLSHRLPVAVAAKQAGYDVHVATMAGDAVNGIVALGFVHHELPLTRSGMNPLKELFAFFAIYKLFRKLKPDLTHLVTIKPVLYGDLAARFAGVPGVVAAVPGLGFVFVAKGLKATLIRQAVKRLYRLAFGKRNLRVIFQNSDDRDTFSDSGYLATEKTVLIPGSGVDFEQYFPNTEPNKPPIVIMAARLLRDKGVGEFAEAACNIKQQGIVARFLLAGEIDPNNPESMTDDEMAQIKAQGNVETLGYRDDIPTLFATSSIVVLPSYREGLPKMLIEAAASGCAVVTTDAPGCRDAIEADVTGLLVPVRDVDALTDAIKSLLQDPVRCKAMGKAGRQRAERLFDIDDVVATHMRIYDELSGLVDG